MDKSPEVTAVTPYYEDELVTLYHGDCRDILPTLTADVLVTDPPYPGREDLFTTEGLDGLLSLIEGGMPGFVFWPCVPPYPSRTPDAVHVWHKAVPIHPRSVTGNVAGHQYERILAYGLGAKCEVFRIAAIMPNFAACRDETVEHPTQKPLTLVVQLCDRTKGVILDPFVGSGTTLVAAREIGRHAIGIEINEAYCEIAAKRLAQGVLFGEFG